MEKLFNKTIAHLLSILLIFGAVTTGLAAFGGAGFDAYANEGDDTIEASDLVLVVWSRIAKDEEGNFIKIAFDEEESSNEWQGSSAQTWCMEYYDTLQETEVGPYIVGVLNEEDEDAYTGDLDFLKAGFIDGTTFDGSDPEIDKVFFLSGKEYYDNSAYIKSGNFSKYGLDGWLLRSAGSSVDHVLVGVIADYGRMYLAYPNEADCSVRPAMYVNKDFFEDVLEVEVKPGKEVNFAGHNWTILNSPEGIQTFDELLADYKENAKEGLDFEFELAKLLSDYDAEGLAELEAARDAGKAAVDAADSKTAVQNAFEDAVDAMIDVDSVDDIKEAADEALDKYFGAIDQSKYDAAGKAALTAAYNAGKAAIDAAETTEDAKAALAAALKSLDAVKSVTGAKEEAKKALDDYFKTKDPASYDDEGKAALTAALNSGKAAIDAQTTTDGVNAALNSAKANLDAVTKVIVDLKAVKIKSAKAGKKSVKVTWKKVSKKNLKKTKKIEIQYSTDKTFQTNVKSKFVKAKSKSATIKGLSAKKKYYVRIRAYTNNGTEIHASKWSKTKSAKTK